MQRPLRSLTRTQLKCPGRKQVRAVLSPASDPFAWCTEGPSLLVSRLVFLRGPPCALAYGQGGLTPSSSRCRGELGGAPAQPRNVAQEILRAGKSNAYHTCLCPCSYVLGQIFFNFGFCVGRLFEFERRVIKACHSGMTVQPTRTQRSTLALLISCGWCIR